MQEFTILSGTTYNIQAKSLEEAQQIWDWYNDFHADKNEEWADRVSEGECLSEFI